MNLSKISVEKPVFAWMLMLGLMLFGILSLKEMGVGMLPDIDAPQVNVRIDYPGAAPELIESDITEVVEGALVGVEGVKDITSTSRFGSSTINLEFDISRDIDAAVQDVQSAMQSAVRNLPTEIDPPVISKSNPEDRPIIWIGLSADKPERELMAFARNYVIDRFSSVEGVGEIQLGGALEPQIRVWLDPKKLSRYELTADDIVRTIQQEHRETPVGYTVSKTSETNLRILGEATSVQDLGNIAITTRSGSPIFEPIRIRDLGTVVAGLEEPRRLSRVKGERAVGLGIKKQRGVNTIAVADGVMQRMKQIDLPPGYKLQINFDSTNYIRESVHELWITLGLSVMLTALVCWLFLGSIATTVNVLFAIPTSLLGTMLVIKYLGFTLNSFTMLAIILVVGIVVDDTIMILENILRMRQEGKSAREAAIEGAKQIGGAAAAATLAIIAIFIPIAFVDGVMGAYLYQFGITLCVAVAISLLEALTFTPMRLSAMKALPQMKGIPLWVENTVHKWGEKYAQFIVTSLKRPWLIYVIAVGVFSFSLLLVKFIPKEFVPPADSGSIFARAELPLGTSLEESSRRFADAEKIIHENPNIEKIYTVVGGFGGSASNTGIFFITLKNKKERRVSQTEVENQLRKAIRSNLRPDLQIRIQSSGGGGFGGRRGYPVELNLKGSDWKLLTQAALELQETLAKEKEFADVDSNYDEGSPEIAIVPNRDAALARGVSVETLSNTLRFLFQGMNAGRFNDDGRRSEIIVQADRKFVSDNPDQLSQLFVRNNRNNLVPVGAVVKFEKKVSAVSISRDNRVRNIEIYSNVGDGYKQGDAIKKALSIAEKILPEGVFIEKTGSSKQLDDSLRDITFAILLGIVVAYMVLASQYNSYIHPIGILIALPFSVTGAWAALYLGQSSINFYSMIGLLLLMGLVKKNSIMLVEFANQLREEEGLKPAEAIVKSGKIRLRPILMTSIATMAAALPPAIGIGHSSSSSQPLALVIFGGTLFATALTLFVVPMTYTHLCRLERSPKA